MIIATTKGAVFLGSIAIGSLMLGSAADSLGPETNISIGSALATGGVVIGGAWWISRKFAMQEMMHQSNQRRFRQIEHALNLLCRKAGIYTEIDNDETDDSISDD